MHEGSCHCGAVRMKLPSTPEVATEEFVPVYARRGRAARGSQKKVRTWMILAPIAGVALIGGGALMLMNNGGAETTPLAEPAVAPAAAPITAAPVAPAGTEMSEEITSDSVEEDAVPAG